MGVVFRGHRAGPLRPFRFPRLELRRSHDRRTGAPDENGHTKGNSDMRRALIPMANNNEGQWNLSFMRTRFSATLLTSSSHAVCSVGRNVLRAQKSARIALCGRCGGRHEGPVVRAAWRRWQAAVHHSHAGPERTAVDA